MEWSYSIISFFKNFIMMMRTSESADSFSQTAEIILPPQFPNDPPVLK